MRRSVAALIALATLVVALPAAAVPTRNFEGVTIVVPGEFELAPVFLAGRDDVVRLIAPNGLVVRSWEAEEGAALGHPLAVNRGEFITFKSYDDGRTSLVHLDFDGNVLFELFEPEGKEFHHDFDLLENGNYLILCRQDLERPEISDQTIEDDCLMEVNPEGEIVWEWTTADHFDAFGFSQEVQDGIFAAGGDWAHANAASPIPADNPHTDPRFLAGNIIMSYRFVSRVAVVDRSTGDIVWTGQFSIGQHDTQMVPGSLPGGGNITIFNNGFGEHYDSSIDIEDHSSVVEVDPITEEVVWEYTAEMSNLPRWHFYSHFISSAQRLANGNTLICEGALGRVFEVTPEGKIVWEFVSPWTGPSGRSDDSPPSNRLYRARKVTREWMPIPLPR